MLKFKKGDLVKRPLYIDDEWEMRVFIVERMIGERILLGYSCRDLQTNEIHNFWVDDSSNTFPNIKFQNKFKLKKATKNEAIVYGL